MGYVKIKVPFWVPIIIGHLLFRVPKKGTLILTTTQVGLNNLKGSLKGYYKGSIRVL